MPDQSVQFAILEKVVAILGGNDAGAWRCRLRNFALNELPAHNVIPFRGEAEYSTFDVERKYRFTIRHLAAAKDSAGEPVDGADRAADLQYVAAQQLLMADRTLGGLAKLLWEVNQQYEFESGTADIVALAVTYEVEFSTQITDPATPGL